MHRMMDDMAGTMPGMMSHCSSAAMHQTSNMMSRMDAEMREHAGALENAMNIDSAQAMCVSHLSAMRETIARMRGTLGHADCGMMSR